MAADTTTALAQLLEPHGVLAWLATYLVHSTLLLGAAWLASRRLRGRSLPLEERLWKAALVGGLLTATVQTGVAALPGIPAPAEAAAAPRALAAPAFSAAAGPAATSATFGEALPRPHPRLGGLAAALPGWQRLALAGWLGGCLLLVGGLALAWLRLRFRLRDREDVASGPAGRLLHRILARTAVRRPVRLTGTTALPVPVALGVGEREICLPRRALRELDERRQEGLLAHELAHLERRDPAWLLAALALQSVFFFQPLNRLARRRLEEISELRCDEWAVRATGDRVALAGCLTEVASWLVAERSPLPAPGMARSRLRLGDRVRRILEGGADGPARRRWVPTAAAAGLLAAVLLVPGLAPATFADADAAAAPVVAAEPATPPAEGEPAGDPEPRAEASPELLGGTHRDPDHDDHRDQDHDHDFDFDWDGSDLPSAEEISRHVARALAAAEASMPDAEEWAEIQEEMREAVEEAMEARREALEEVSEALEIELEGLHEGRALSAAEEARLRAEIEREVAAAREEAARALEDAGPELEALREMDRYLNVEMAEELRRARRELERMSRELREAHRELEREQGGLEERRRVLERRHRELRERREGPEREEEAPPPLR